MKQTRCEELFQPQYSFFTLGTLKSYIRVSNTSPYLRFGAWIPRALGLLFYESKPMKIRLQRDEPNGPPCSFGSPRTDRLVVDQRMQTFGSFLNEEHAPTKGVFRAVLPSLSFFLGGHLLVGQGGGKVNGAFLRPQVDGRSVGAAKVSV